MKGKIALITGGSRELGKCIAEKFLESEATVIIVDIIEKLEENTQKELSALGSIVFRKCDISQEDEVEE